MTYSSYLLKKTQNNKELNEDLQVIVRETKRSRDIVKSLLDFGRQTMPQKRPADINEILENSLQVVKNQLQLLHVKVVKNYKKALPDIKIDANQIQQVFINLLVNSADAIGEKGGQIQIQTTLVSLSAHGVIQVKKAVCPKGHNLINNQSRIDGLPSLSLKFKEKNNSGNIQIDPVYGLHRDVISKKINNPAEVSFLCTKCETSMNSKDKKCPECSSNIYIIDVPDEGTIEGCCNPACNWQHWNLTDIDRVNDYIEIHIKDNGEGIPSQHVSHIFDPFYSTKGTKGTGLGLSVVWGIIDNHDGIIKVESEEKKGTEFIIRLPVK